MNLLATICLVAFFSLFTGASCFAVCFFFVKEQRRLLIEARRRDRAYLRQAFAGNAKFVLRSKNESRDECFKIIGDATEKQEKTNQILGKAIFELQGGDKRKTGTATLQQSRAAREQRFIEKEKLNAEPIVG